MIRNLDDLIAYTERLAKALPESAGRVHIASSGCPSAVVATLQQTFPNLPESYVSVIRTIRIDGIAVGYFELTPSSAQTKDLVEKLRRVNDPAVAPMAEHYRRYGVCQVAAWEADPICVTVNDGAFRVGQIVKFSTAAPGAAPAFLADTFEQFLLLAGNLDEARADYGHEPARAIEVFRRYLETQDAGRAEEMQTTWMRIARVVLG